MDQMQVTRDVITDLLPLYFAGEVSADTARLVESYFAQDPDFGAKARQLADAAAGVPRMRPAEEAKAEKAALERARSLVQNRNAMLGCAIAYTLAPLLFSFNVHGIRFVMLRDHPFQAVVFFLAGVACWIAYFVLRRKTQATGV
jgi:hypothetical protein